MHVNTRVCGGGGGGWMTVSHAGLRSDTRGLYS